MHNREKYPEIWAAKERAEQELKPLMEKRKIHTDKIAKTQLKIDRIYIRKGAADFSSISFIIEL